MTHADLVARAVRWLLNSRGCCIAFSEFCTSGPRGYETPDAIGWQGAASVLVECKTSRADFAADRHKRFRRHDRYGLGSERYYMVPRGLLTVNDVPPKWGLLEVGPRQVRTVRQSEGFAARDRLHEIAFLVSMLRRAQVRLKDTPLGEWLRYDQRSNGLPSALSPERSGLEASGCGGEG